MAEMRKPDECRCPSVIECMPVAEAAMIRKGCREFVLPMFFAAVAAGAVGQPIPQQPQYDAAITRFWASPSIAAFFRVTSMVIATDNQLMEINPFNLDLFIPNNFSNVQLMVPVRANGTVELIVNNLDPVNAHDFSAAFKGYVQKYC